MEEAERGKTSHFDVPTRCSRLLGKSFLLENYFPTETFLGLFIVSNAFLGDAKFFDAIFICFLDTAKRRKDEKCVFAFFVGVLHKASPSALLRPRMCSGFWFNFVLFECRRFPHVRSRKLTHNETEDSFAEISQSWRGAHTYLSVQCKSFLQYSWVCILYKKTDEKNAPDSIKNTPNRAYERCEASRELFIFRICIRDWTQYVETNADWLTPIEKRSMAIKNIDIKSCTERCLKYDNWLNGRWFNN